MHAEKRTSFAGWVLFLALMIVCLTSQFSLAETISPTTGLPIPGEPVAPMLVVINNSEGTVKENGKTIKAPGVGKLQPWGGLQADMVIESVLTERGYSRLAFLFHDALVRGEAIQAGPVRSVRDVHVKLAASWNAGLVCSASHPYSAPALNGYQGQVFDLGMKDRDLYLTRMQGKKHPNNISVDVSALHGLMETEKVAVPWLSFGDDPGQAEKITTASMEIKWGEKGHTTKLVYDEGSGKYQWFANGTQIRNWRDTTFTEEAPMAFDNVVILSTDFSYPVSTLLPVVELTGQGQGVVMSGDSMHTVRWQEAEGRLTFVDETDGTEVLLQPGITYLAITPVE